MRNTQRGLAENGRIEMVPGGSGDLQRCLFLFNGRRGVGEVFKSNEISCIKKNQDLRKDFCVSSGLKTQKEKIYWNFWDFSAALGDNRKNGMKPGLS